MITCRLWVLATQSNPSSTNPLLAALGWFEPTMSTATKGPYQPENYTTQSLSAKSTTNLWPLCILSTTKSTASWETVNLGYFNPEVLQPTPPSFKVDEEFIM